MQITISRAAIDAIFAHAAKVHPDECCGLLLGAGSRAAEARAAANVHPEPARHFEIDPQALVDAHRSTRMGGPELIGYYHSHPAGAAVPSATDRAAAAGDGRVWAIVARDVVTFWRDGEEGFAALSYTVDDR